MPCRVTWAGPRDGQEAEGRGQSVACGLFGVLVEGTRQDREAGWWV